MTTHKANIRRVLFWISLALLCSPGVWHLLVGCSREPRRDPGEEVQSAIGMELRVMSFNIRYGTADDGPNSWDFRKDRVIELIRNSQVDVMGLQEALRFQLNEIRSALPEYDEIGVARDDGAAAGEYAAILYSKKNLRVLESETFWFSETPSVPGSKHWGNQLPRICTWARFKHRPSGLSFYAYNLHLDHQSRFSREKSAVLLSQRIQKRNYVDPVIVMGDFNAGENDDVIRFLKREKVITDEEGHAHSSSPPLTDSFRKIFPEAEEVGTFHGFTGEKGGPKVDYIFVSDEFTIYEAGIDTSRVLGGYPSDHFPVTARLFLPVLISPEDQRIDNR